MLELRDRRVDLTTGAVFGPGSGSGARLTTRELALLSYLAARPGQSVSREALLAEVWGYSASVLSRACDNTLHRLRQKLEVDPATPVHLLTLFGEGYSFAPVRTEQDRVAAAQEPAGAVLALGTTRVDLAHHRAFTAGGEVSLSAREVEILGMLAAARGAVVDRAALGHGRSLDNAVHRLRSKLEPEPDAPRFLMTERGGGYRLVLVVADAVVEPESAIFGRDRAAADVLAALGAARWVVITGPGGMGKTRLARRVVAGHGAVVWVDLAPARSDGDVVSAVAAALRLPGSAQMEAALSASLGALGPAWLVLDNLEQVVELAAPRIVEWLAAAPELRLLGTSRIRLGLDGERAVELAPLDESDGVRLFVDRARAVSSGFNPSGEVLQSVRALVGRLDGLPLAIELAAARVGVLTPSQMLERVERRLDLLARPRAQVARHRSLRAVLAGSWELLSAEEAQFLCALALFGSGFDLVDVEGLAGPDGLERLSALRDHSLVHSRADGLPFGIFEAIREFAAEQRAQLPDGGRELELRQVRWLARLGLVEHTARLYRRGEEERTADQRRRADDLERALETALAWSEPELAADLALAAGAVRVRTGPFAPLLERVGRIASPPRSSELALLEADLARMLDRPEDALAAVERGLGGTPSVAVHGALLDARSKALADLSRFELGAVAAEQAADRLAPTQPHLGCFLRARGLVYRDTAGLPTFPEQALALYEQAAELAARVGDPFVEGAALHQLARFDVANGRPRLGRERYLAAADQLRRAHAFAASVEVSRNSLIVLMNLGDWEAHERIGAEALELARRSGLLVEQAIICVYLASGRIVRGSHREARAAAVLAREVLARTRSIPRTLGYLELREAEMYLAEGDPASAEVLARSARRRFEQISDAHNQERADVVLAMILAAMGREAEALGLANACVRSFQSGDPLGNDLPLALASRGHVYLASGAVQAARADLAEGRAAASRIGMGAPESAASLALARLAAALRE